MRCLAIFGLVACLSCNRQGGTDPDANGGHTEDADGGTPDFNDAIAFIRVVENRNSSGQFVSTHVRASFPSHALGLYRESARGGACRLLLAEFGGCSEPCDGSCTPDEECHPYPDYLSAGMLTISGLTEPLSFEGYDGRYDCSSDAQMIPGSAITAATQGDEFSEVSLSARAVEPLVGVNTAELRLQAGSDVVIRWPQTTPGFHVRLTIMADTASHGQFSLAVLRCDALDEGTLVVPAALVDLLVEPSYWGCENCPGAQLLRYRRSTTMAGVLSNGRSPVREH